MEKMNASFLEISQNTSNAAESADAVKQGAEQGNKVIENAVCNMQEINQKAKEMQDSLNKLGVDVKGVNQVMSLIEDIADQTNLLALNAAVEAARAGESGRGFAVVADEVRKLAEKTISATKEVGEIITKIHSKTEQNVQDMNEAEKNITSTTDLVQNAGNSFIEFVRQAEENSEGIRNIATASEEQSTTSEQIARSTEEVNRTASEATESMQECAQEINNLVQLNSDLKDTINSIR